MIERILMAGALVVTAAATPAFAGDQPVFATGWPTVVDHVGRPIVSLPDRPTAWMRAETVNTAVPGAVADVVGAPRGTGTSVTATSLSRSDVTSLHSRLMAEARDRGLK